MEISDGRAMFELQLELHARAVGRKPIITSDEVLEVRQLLAELGDLTSVLTSR